jgi:SAM-dependent methyltransferase
VTAGYTFGHSASAAERLRILAAVYESETEAFIRAYAPRRPGLAIDLGCGPGYTTALLARASGAERTAGFDISPEFVALAAAERGDAATFHVHDVTAPPFSAGEPDLLFCRLLLTHLPDPRAALAAWAGALRPGGRLLIDEVDAIEAPDPVCARYLAIADGVVRSTGGSLYVGPLLGGLAPPSAAIVADEAVPCEVAARDAASMFRLNIPNWAETAITAGLTTTDELAVIAGRMDALASGEAEAPPLRWHMRHLVLERQAG